MPFNFRLRPAFLPLFLQQIPKADRRSMGLAMGSVSL
jgi:hypothetical protein